MKNENVFLIAFLCIIFSHIFCLSCLAESKDRKPSECDSYLENTAYNYWRVKLMRVFALNLKTKLFDTSEGYGPMINVLR